MRVDISKDPIATTGESSPEMQLARLMNAAHAQHEGLVPTPCDPSREDHLLSEGSWAKQPQPYIAASPTLPSTFRAIPPDDTPDARWPASPHDAGHGLIYKGTARIARKVEAGCCDMPDQSWKGKRFFPRGDHHESPEESTHTAPTVSSRRVSSSSTTGSGPCERAKAVLLFMPALLCEEAYAGSAF